MYGTTSGREYKGYKIMGQLSVQNPKRISYTWRGIGFKGSDREQWRIYDPLWVFYPPCHCEWRARLGACVSFSKPPYPQLARDVFRQGLILGWGRWGDPVLSGHEWGCQPVWALSAPVAACGSRDTNTAEGVGGI